LSSKYNRLNSLLERLRKWLTVIHPGNP
jgi:hypothetical protein